MKEQMTMDNADILATMKSTKDQYGFLNALFDDYSLHYLQV